MDPYRYEVNAFFFVSIFVIQLYLYVDILNRESFKTRVKCLLGKINHGSMDCEYNLCEVVCVLWISCEAILCWSYA